jgi:diguanylate cyclase (GGDEF)-like protein
MEEGLSLNNGQEVGTKAYEIKTIEKGLLELERKVQTGEITRGEAITRTAEKIYEANRDNLTELISRDIFLSSAEQEIAEAQRHPEDMVIIFADLNGLHGINTKYNHKVGDLMLKAVGLAIGFRKRDSDLAARYGGDEFIVMCTHVKVDAIPTLVSGFQEMIDFHLASFVKNTGISEEDAQRVGIALGSAVITKEKIAQLPKDPTPVERKARRMNLLEETIAEADEAMLKKKTEMKANRTS